MSALPVRVRFRLAVLIGAAFFVGCLLHPRAETPKPRKEKRNLVAVRAVSDIARLERQRRDLRADIETLQAQLEAGDRERAKLEQLLVQAQAPEAQTHPAQPQPTWQQIEAVRQALAAQLVRRDDGTIIGRYAKSLLVTGDALTLDFKPQAGQPNTLTISGNVTLTSGFYDLSLVPATR